MELRMYKYRLYPSRKQKERVINSLKTCKQIYNELLALSIDSWNFGKISLHKFDYCAYLKEKHKEIHSQVKQNVADRVHKAFQNFFRRVKDKSCKDKGFPRFKSRVNSLTFPQCGFKIMSDKRLHLSKIGNIPIILHRIPKGKIKTLTIKQNKVGQWFAVFSCEIETPKPIHPSNEMIGIDVNSEDNFCYLSNGERVENPKFLVKNEKRLKLLQRRLSRKVKGSNNRRKARFRLARLHNKIVNQRMDFQHKLSHRLTKSFCIGVVENLNIKNMVNNSWNAKFINDASWNTFINMLSYKAVTCGGQLIKVNPRNTSKTCSKCETIVESLPLSQRQFICPTCDFVCHRDLNASINILRVGMDYAKLNACGDSTPTTKLVASGIVESGTTYGK